MSKFGFVRVLTTYVLIFSFKKRINSSSSDSWSVATAYTVASKAAGDRLSENTVINSAIQGKKIIQCYIETI